jgi:hypothetical protein
MPSYGIFARLILGAPQRQECLKGPEYWMQKVTFVNGKVPDIQ